MNTISTPSITQSQPKESLTRLAYGVLFLVVTTAAYFVTCVRYDAHLIGTRQFSSLRSIHEYSELRDCLFYVIQLLIVMILFFRPVRQIFVSSASGSPAEGGLHLPRDIGWGVLSGVIGLLAMVPIFLSQKPSKVGTFLANHLYSAGGVILLVLLIFLLPTAIEGFFRGILLRRLLDEMSAPSALIVATLLFVLYWPFFSLFASATIGIVTGIVFYRTRSVPACIIANSTFTIGAITFLTLRAV